MKYSLDALVMQDERLFAYGWAFHPTRRVRRQCLRVLLADGQAFELALTEGKERGDVAAIYPDVAAARWSGWMAYGGWQGGELRRLELTGTFEDGEEFALLLKEPAVRTWKERMRDLLRQLQAPDAAAEAERVVKTPVPDASVVDAIRHAIHGAGLERMALVIDHAMGGGANHYRDEYVRLKLIHQPVLGILSFEVRSLRFRLELVAADGPLASWHCEHTIALALAASGLVGEVLYNDAVSFPRAGDVPAWLQAFVRGGADLTFAVHDYLAICPSPFLLNDSNRFCGVPDLAECRRCMPLNGNDFPNVRPAPDLAQWRSAWGAALAVAGSVRCFSESSRELLLRAYPELPRQLIVVQPHGVKAFERRPVLQAGPLHIGVVGAIGMHKGAHVLQELAHEIAARGLPIRITVFGTVEAALPAGVVEVTGLYQRDELPLMIERSGANIFLLPSICPETFSYVTHELIQLGLPLACFDLGAPADKVRDYRLGRVLPLRGGAKLLDDLASFHEAIHIKTQARAL